MNQSKQGYKKGYRTLIYIIIFMVSVFCIFIYQTIDDILFSSIIKDLGVAGIVALMLTFTIEHFNRKDHEDAAADLVDEINKNLFQAIYKRNIPEKIFSEVEKCLLNTPVYRTNYNIDYHIQAVSEDLDQKLDKGKHVICQIITEYDIVNISGGNIEFAIPMDLELPISDAWEDYCKVTGVEVGGKKLSSQEVKDSTEKDKTHVRFSYTTTILADQSIKVVIEAILLKQIVDSESWASKIPSDGIKLAVSTSIEGLDVNASANHNERLKERKQHAGSYKWDLDYGIFPHQSIIFWWKMRE